MLQDVAAVLGVFGLRGEVGFAGTFEPTCGIFCRERLLPGGGIGEMINSGRFSEAGVLRQYRAATPRVEPMRTERQQRFAVIFYSALAFVVGMSVGAFVMMSYVSSYVREAVR